ncbi:hypothetical protein ABC628_03265 [Lentilactobacillus otakiensis]|uniref:Uncharacterized protein n=1 Tax=Lentilactobacillus otakiensis DSM 19908 = JCM 15040 TaxID=1423780 RepID=S4NE98_9LACO|nr:hypothetical protein [Lentilactobacillus otakiensis]KRL10912.1 hypothetical protein FD05_GL000062 [Lentilactobacillus otakiensis DSM 19908 = JCM 15040]MBZ3777143.1 hypothetical protein [Lentilactobacillus otakiensis]MDV3517740.1 hypothetical protein [Lentilactobacillus otakiensis]GAD17249.1 conserved hypothetical protein [Lentilactobacillus otakiensis DSM 19908 = JCM 15040]
MKVFLDITDCLMLYLLISLWIGDFLSKNSLGKSSSYVSRLVSQDASPLKVAIKYPVRLAGEKLAFVTKKLRGINHWYWLASKTKSMIFLLVLEEWLVMTAKQNWGLIAVELTMLAFCAIILAADLRVNLLRSQLEKALKPYEDRLWFEYRFKKE